MSAKGNLLDRAKAATGSDSETARRIHASRQIVSNWRKDQCAMTEDRVMQICKIAGENPENWLVAIAAQQATGDAAKRWKNIAQRLGIAASLFTLVTALFPTTTHTADGASAKNTESNAYYVNKIWRWDDLSM